MKRFEKSFGEPLINAKGSLARKLALLAMRMVRRDTKSGCRKIISKG